MHPVTHTRKEVLHSRRQANVSVTRVRVYPFKLFPFYTFAHTKTDVLQVLAVSWSLLLYTHLYTHLSWPRTASANKSRRPAVWANDDCDRRCNEWTIAAHRSANTGESLSPLSRNVPIERASVCLNVDEKQRRLSFAASSGKRHYVL